eukprot:scaffold93080_cov19-Tisochrysis_lutea.AAC.1
METLRQSIQAIESWKQLYEVTKKAICARSPRPWDFSVSPIFAHIDAFLQRCNDLLEVGGCVVGSLHADLEIAKYVVYVHGSLPTLKHIIEPQHFNHTVQLSMLSLP